MVTPEHSFFFFFFSLHPAPPSPQDAWSRCSAGVQGGVWQAEQGDHCFLSPCQLPMPGDPAVVLGEVGARGVAGRAGRLCRAEQQRAHPPPAVPVLCGQRGWCHRCSGGGHQVSAVGAVPGMEGSPQVSFSM